MSLMLRAVGVALASLAVLLVLRGTKGELAVFVKALGVLLLFGMTVSKLSSGVTEICEIVSAMIDPSSFVSVAVSVMVKALGIALIGKICADVCKECGENGIAQGVEAVAGVVIFSLSLPILAEILNFASDVLSRGS